MIIIGITGTLGAGKGTIVEYLVGEKEFSHYSVRAFVTEEIIRRGMPVNRDSMVVVANDLRAKHTPSYITDELFKRAKTKGGNSVIESIRTPGEVESLRKYPEFYLFAVDAPAEIRYQRIKARGSETDQVSLAEFLENEKREMNSTDPNKQNIAMVMDQADVVFRNEGSIKQLNAEVERALKKLNFKS